MKLFSCVCQQLVFFESVSCTRCGRTLAFLPDRAVVTAVVEEPGGGGPAGATRWRAADAPGGPRYRPCRNSREHGVCNWAVPEDDAGEYCRACRLNETIPNLDDPAARERWHRLEIAKRRLIYSLLDLGLPVESKRDDPARGLAFAFLQAAPEAPVFTGHMDGLVTINVAEADDPFREKMRARLGEAYRTILGHFRHEIGHYYWDRLIAGAPWLSQFRERFGDERMDYEEAQRRYYDAGPAADWARDFVSAYASMHPWEDWAETWAHYLHMTDTLETARAYGLALRPPSEPGAPLAVGRVAPHAFEDLATLWIPLTMALNGLNRSMGLADPYPFVLGQSALAKLRFVHDVIQGVAQMR